MTIEGFRGLVENYDSNLGFAEEEAVAFSYPFVFDLPEEIGEQGNLRTPLPCKVEAYYYDAESGDPDRHFFSVEYFFNQGGSLEVMLTPGVEGIYHTEICFNDNDPLPYSRTVFSRLTTWEDLNAAIELLEKAGEVAFDNRVNRLRDQVEDLLAGEIRASFTTEDRRERIVLDGENFTIEYYGELDSNPHGFRRLSFTRDDRAGSEPITLDSLRIFEELIGRLQNTLPPQN